MSDSNPIPVTIRSDILCRFLESDYETIRFAVNDPANGYWLADFRVGNPSVKQEYIDPDRRDGQRPVAASRKKNLKKLTLTMHIQGTSKEDLATKVSAFLSEIERDVMKLEYRPPGWEHSQVYTCYPWVGMDYAGWWRTAVQENNRLVDFKIELDCEPDAEGAGPQESLPILASLGPNDDLEEWTGDVPDGWDVLEEGTATIEPSYSPLTGAAAALISGGASGGTVWLTDDAFIAVTEADSYTFQAMVKHTAGDDPDASIYAYHECYNSAEALLGYASGFDYDFEADYNDEWLNAALMYYGYYGTTKPSSSSGAPRWLVGTAKVKRVIKVDVPAGESVYLDSMHFSDTQQLVSLVLSALMTSQHPSGLIALNVAPGVVKGDKPAPCDIYINQVYKTVNKLVIGQRKPYHAGFSPIKNADDLVVVSSVEVVLPRIQRFRHSYHLTNVPSNLITDDPWFQEFSGTGNTTDWDHWDEIRYSSTGYELWGVTITPHYGSGTAEAWVYSDFLVPGYVNHGLLHTTMIAVDSGLRHMQILVAYAEGWQSQPWAKLRLELMCYNAADALLGAPLVWEGYATVMGQYAIYGGYIEPEGEAGLAFPAGTAKVKPQFRQYGQSCHAQFNLWGYAGLYAAPRIGDCAYDVEAHRGTYMPLMGLGLSDAITAYDTLTLKGRVAWEDEEAGTTDYEDISELRIGSPDSIFTEPLWGPQRPGELVIPSQAVPDDAGTLEQRLVLEMHPLVDNTRDVWQEFFAICPTDRAFLEVVDLDAEHVIINCASDKPKVLVSADGTLAKSKVHSPLSWKPSPAFEADPAGMNMLVRAVSDNEGDMETWCIFDMEIRYRPRYEIMTEG